VIIILNKNIYCVQR